MFTVVIRALADSVQDMQQMVRRLNQQIQEAEDIVSSIRRLSAYDETIHSLRIQLENMNTERRRLMDMMAALGQIQKMYMQCERNITDYGDAARQINDYRSMDVVYLDGIQDTIREYRIR